MGNLLLFAGPPNSLRHRNDSERAALLRCASTAPRSGSTAAHFAQRLVGRRCHVRHHDGDGAGGVRGGHVRGLNPPPRRGCGARRKPRRGAADRGPGSACRARRRRASGWCRSGARISASERLRSAERRDDEVTMAIGHSAAASASSSSSVLGLSGRPARHEPRRGWRGRRWLISASGKRSAVAIEQHGLAGRPGKADHGMAERDGVIGVAAHVERCDQAVEIDLLGVEQRAVHVEQDGADGPLRGHVAPATALFREFAQAGRAKTVAAVAPASAGGTPRRNTSMAPTGCSRIRFRMPRRRGGAWAKCFQTICHRTGRIPRFNAELIPGSSPNRATMPRSRYYAREAAVKGNLMARDSASRPRCAQSV